MKPTRRGFLAGTSCLSAGLVPLLASAADNAPAPLAAKAPAARKAKIARKNSASERNALLVKIGFAIRIVFAGSMPGASLVVEPAVARPSALRLLPKFAYVWR